MNAKEAVEFVLHNGNGYAAAYAQTCLAAWGQYDTDWIESQLLYILSNFAGCRKTGHEVARRKLKEMLFEAMDGKVPE